MIDGDRHISITSVINPVTGDGAQRAAQAIRGSGQGFAFDAIVHLGLNAKSSTLHIELCGFNHAVESGSKARDDGPEILPSLLNVRRLCEMNHLKEGEIEFSRDAGTYYCNEQLYSSLYELSKCEMYRPCLFLHLPAKSVQEIEKYTKLVEEVIKATCIL